MYSVYIIPTLLDRYVRCQTDVLHSSGSNRLMHQDILLIQSDDADGRAVQAALCGCSDNNFHVAWVRDCAAGLEWLAAWRSRDALREDCDVAVVLDLLLPDVQGIETFERLYRVVPQVPILVLCSSKTEAVARMAVRSGAQDYLLKEDLDSYLIGKALRNMIQRAANARSLNAEAERARVTLASIGDAVVSSDTDGRITYLNGVAEALTGWTSAAATGHSVEEVLRLIEGTTRARIRNPMSTALRDDMTVGLTENCVLIGHDGNETFIEDSAAPIHDRCGQVTGAVMVFRDVSATRALARRMSFLAQHDSLTELANRTLLQDRLTQCLAFTRRRPEKKLALLFVDIDGFKTINDSLGHAVGDMLLQSVARRLLGCVRKSDMVGRLGGDEFVVLLPELRDSHDAVAIAEKILRALRAPHRLKRQLVRITGSIGIATLPEDGADADLLMSNADLAMYRAKASGRDNYQLFEPAWAALAVGRHALPSRERLSA